MSKSSNRFFIDLLGILPNDAEFLIQAPSIDNLSISKMVKNSINDGYQVIHLSSPNKIIMIQQEIDNFFSIYINSLIVNKDERKIFEGYDGVEFGIFSKEVVLPTWFKIKYVPEMCLISKQW